MNNEHRERREFEKDAECHVPTFGHPTGNNGWIQCRSKTFPEKYYYFNVDSRSRTWGRPLADCVPVPIVHSVNLPRDEDFWDEVSIGVSDIEDDSVEDFDTEQNIDVKPPIGAKEAKRRKIFSEVLFKLYHCYGDDYCNIGDIISIKNNGEASLMGDTKFDIKIEESDESQSILPEISYSSSSDSESYESKPNKNRQRLLFSRSVSKPNFKERGNKRNDVSDFWGRQNRPEVRNFRYGKLGQWQGEKRMENRVVNWMAGRKLPLTMHKDCKTLTFGLDSEDADEEDDDVEDDSVDEKVKVEFKKEDEGIKDNSNGLQSGLFLPRLKAIEFADLITDSKKPNLVEPTKPTKRGPPKRVTIKEDSDSHPPAKKDTKIIYEINGIKTISYDFRDPELPPGVKATNLSDTGSSTTEKTYYNWAQAKTPKISVFGIKLEDRKDFVFNDDLFDMKEPRLSDSDSEANSLSTLIGNSKNHPILLKSESDSSESSSSSSSSSSTCSTLTASMTSINTKVKKEEADSTGTLTPRGEKHESSIDPNLTWKRKIKFESGESSRSSSNEDKSWIMSGEEIDDDE